MVCIHSVMISPTQSHRGRAVGFVDDILDGHEWVICLRRPHIQRIRVVDVNDDHVSRLVSQFVIYTVTFLSSILN